MFIKLSDARRLFKKAYKTLGLRIGGDEKGVFLTGRKWYMYVFLEDLPKEVLGEIISLSGALPSQGEQWLCDKGGNQTEIYGTDARHDVYRCAMNAQAHGSRLLASSVILTDEGETPYRVYTGAGKLHIVPEEYMQMIASGNCADDEEMQGCFADESGWIYWVSSHMAFGISPYEIEELDVILDELQEAGIV